MAGSTTKTVLGSYCLIGFPTNGQAKGLPMPHGNASGGTPREPPGSLPTQGWLPPSRVVNLRYATPGRLRPLSGILITQQQSHRVNEIGATTQVNIWAPYHDTTFF